NAVRLRRRQGEHRTRGRLLRGGAVVRGGQGTATAPGRPGVLGVLRGYGLLGPDLLFGRRGARGQRRRQGRLPATVTSRTPAASAGRGHALRRNGPAQPRTHGCGPRAVLAG